MVTQFAQRLITSRWLIVLGCLCLIIVAAIGLAQLQFNGNHRVFFGPEDPKLIAFDQMQATYNKSDNVAIIIAPKNGTVFTAKALTLVWQLTDQAWQIPHSLRVDSISNYQHTQSEDDDLLVEDLLLEVEDLNSEKIANIKAVALNEPLLLHKLVAANGDSTVVNVTIQLPGQDLIKELPQTGDYVDSLVAQYRLLYPEIDIFTSGVIEMNRAFASEAQHDASTLIPAMFATVVIVLGLLLRSLNATLATLVIIITSIVSTMGLAGWLGMDITTTTVNVPTIVMTLAVADCVHIVAGVLYFLAQGQTKYQSIINSYQLNFSPILLTSITTSIGFLTLNFSYSPAMNDLGNLVAIGVMLAFAFSVTLFPALLALIPLKVVDQSSSNRGFVSLANFIISRYRQVALLATLAVVAISSQLFNNVINDVAIDYFSTKTEFRQSTDYMSDHLSGLSQLDYAIDSGEENGINEPEFLKTIAAFEQWLLSQPETDHVSAITTIVKRLNKNMHGDDPTYYQLPESRELSAQYLLMYEMSLPYGLDLNNMLNVSKSATRVSANFTNLGSSEVISIEQRSYAWFAKFAPQLSVSIASTNLIFAYIGDRNMVSMLIGSAVALVLISFLVGLSLKSVRLGLISLVPNIAPAALGFGIWGMLDGQINLALSVVTSITLGIVVDDTIHFLSKYQLAKNSGLSTSDAIRSSFSLVGRALLITTIVLAIGFSILTLSNFTLNSDMGLLTAIIIVIALLVDFILLPAMLLIFDNQTTSDNPISPTDPKEVQHEH
ncbi:MAG: MMPL family transporter [Gammaproteobacteria bacterium]|nr:MMPL family transporter [Gammaproteobacteria bacterium]